MSLGHLLKDPLEILILHSKMINLKQLNPLTRILIKNKGRVFQTTKISDQA